MAVNRDLWFIDLWILAGLCGAAAAAFALKRYTNRLGRRTVLHSRARIDRFKLTRKQFVIEEVVALPAVVAAVREHVVSHSNNPLVTE